MNKTAERKLERNEGSEFSRDEVRLISQLLAEWIHRGFKKNATKNNGEDEQIRFESMARSDRRKSS